MLWEGSLFSWSDSLFLRLLSLDAYSFMFIPGFSSRKQEHSTRISCHDNYDKITYVLNIQKHNKCTHFNLQEEFSMLYLVSIIGTRENNG